MVVAMAVPALAQGTSAVEVGGGYNLLKIEETNIPAGWYAEVTGRMTPALAIVGQLSANYRNVEQANLNVDAKLAMFMGGARVNFATSSGAVPFVQALFGGARTSGSASVAGLMVSDSRTDAAMQLGGGVKFFPGVIGVQVGADYLHIFSDGDANGVRFAAGVVAGF